MTSRVKRFVFRWLYRLSWIPAAIGFLFLLPMLWLHDQVEPKDRL